MTQGPYGNTSAGSEHLFISYKMLQISQSSEFFLYSKVWMLVQPAHQSLHTPYLALFEINKYSQSQALHYNDLHSEP